MPPKIENKNMASVAKIAIGPGPKTKKLQDQRTDSEKMRDAIIESQKTKVGKINGKTVIKSTQQERLTATPTMKNIGSSAMVKSTPKKESGPVKTSGDVAKIARTVSIGSIPSTPKKEVSKMGDISTTPDKIIPTPVKEIAKEVIKENPIAAFPRGTHQETFKFYGSQINDFVKSNPEWKGLIDTSTPATIKASIEKLPLDYVPSTNPKEAKKGKEVYSDQSQDALVRLLTKKYGEGKPLE